MYKIVFKNQQGKPKIFEGTFKEVWAYLVKQEGDKPLKRVARTFGIERA